MRIKAVACAVPKNIARATDYRSAFGDEAIETSIRGTGVRQWRYVSPDVCASHMCVAVAESLMDHVG